MASLLLVDDNEDIRFLIGLVFRDVGFTVVEAASAQEALAVLDLDDLPDIAVLDVQMPGMDGWELLERIRSDPRTVRLPIVMCSVKATPDNLVHAWELGADGYVAKPFETHELVDEVELVLSHNHDDRVRRRALGLYDARMALNSAEAIYA